jgi:hypothetical protein
MAKLLSSAVANAKNAGINTENLSVGSITVNKGIVMKRSMPRARGSASRINKRTSHIMLTLTEKETVKKGSKKKTVAKESVVTEKKSKSKKSVATA